MARNLSISPPTPEVRTDSSLLAACEAALRFFVEHEIHAPEPLPGAAKIKRQLQEALAAAGEKADEDL